MKRLKTGICVVGIFCCCFGFVFASSSGWQGLEIHWKFRLNFSDLQSGSGVGSR